MRRAKVSKVIKYEFGGLGSSIPFLLILMFNLFCYFGN